MEFTCGYCKTSFKEMEVLENHLKKCQHEKSETEHDQKSEGKPIISQKKVKYPNQAERTKWLFSCSYCDKKFKFIADLKRHELAHTGERPFPCELCSKTFQRRYDLKMHRVTLHPKAIDQHRKKGPTRKSECSLSCSYCANQFKSMADLKRHEIVCTGEKPLRCEAEKYDFEVEHDQKSENKPKSSPKRVKYQNQADRTKRSFSCSYCDKKLNFMSDLKRHEIVHTGEKAFSCDLCTNAFTRKYDLERHRKICQTRKSESSFSYSKKGMNEDKKLLDKSEIFGKKSRS